MRVHAALLSAILLASVFQSVRSAHAADDEEYYLLGDYGVRVDVPEDWRSLEWSDWAFEAEAEDRSLKLFVWGGGVQTPVVADDLEAWKSVHEAKVGTIGGSNPRVVSRELLDVKGRPTARYELAFDFGKDIRGAMQAATFAVEGEMVHAAIITAARRSRKAEDALDGILERSEVRRPPADVSELGTVEAAGVTATLPEGWRAPLERELDVVTERAQALGIDDVEGCWTALHARPAAAPDIMITCQAGMLLGVVDTYSAAAVDAELRELLFGGVEVASAETVETATGDVGFLYRPALEGRALRVGVVPYADGIARTWALGADGSGDLLDAALTHVLTTADYLQPHPAGLGDQAAYYVTHRPTSPVVLGPLALIVLGIVGVAMRGGRRRRGDFDLD